MKTIRLAGYVVTDFVEGDRKVFASAKEDDDAVQALCMRLSSLGRFDEAETLLESYCRR